MEKQKDMENHIKQMELFMKENGRTISKKEKEKKYGQMAQFMKVSFIMGQKVELENLLGGKVEEVMKENLRIIR